MQNPDVSLGDLSYTTTARRLHEVQRDAFVASSVVELCDMLTSKEGLEGPSTNLSSLIFVFPGQGSVYTGMGATLYKTSLSFRGILDSFQASSDSQHLNVNFTDIISGAKDATRASAVETQMALVALEIALAQFWQSLGLRPSLVLGHSLGEYAALCVAGVLSVTDTLYLVYHRAMLIEEHCDMDTHGMLAIAQPAAVVERFLTDNHLSSCEISCINGPSSTVVSGTRDDLRNLEQLLCASRNVKSTELPVRYAFHSAQMDPILDAFEIIAKGVVFATSRIPVASTLLSTVVTEKGVFDSVYLRNQTRQPVNLVDTVRACGVRNGSSTLIDIGPGSTCSKHFTQSLQNVSVKSWGASLQRDKDDWQSVNNILQKAHVAGLVVDWQEFWRYDMQSVRLVDGLPSYAFDLENYWHSYQKQGASRTDFHAAALSPSGKFLEKLSYTSIQFLEDIDVERGIATFLSKPTDPVLLRAIQGHMVDGTAICPMAVFVDMAATAASFLLHKTGNKVKSSSLEIVDMKMTHPLPISQDSDSSLYVRVHAELRNGGQIVDIKASSEDRSKQYQHGSCSIRVLSSSDTTISEWPQIERLVKAQVRTLKRDAEAGHAHRMNKALIYKLFADLVEYSNEYMAIDEAFVAHDFQEAAALINLETTCASGHFTLNPFAVDALVHLAGFLLNANLSKPAGDIYIANHVGSLRVLEDLPTLGGHSLTCFATVREQRSRGQSVCDVYVYGDQRLIATCNDIRFQKLGRDVFRSMIVKTRCYSPPSIPEKPSLSAVSSFVQSSHKDSIDRPWSERTPATTVSTPAIDVHEMLLNTIGKHTGIDASKITPSSKVADLGIDSLMAIAILGDLEKATSLELPAALLTSVGTVAEALQALDSRAADKELAGKHGEAVEVRPSTSAPNAASISGEVPYSDASMTSDISSVSCRGSSIAVSTKVDVSSVTSRALLIHGEHENNDLPLFLITDGSGTISGYIHFPKPPGGRRIYALESPFVERPEDYTISVQEMARVFIQTLCRIQSHGAFSHGPLSHTLCYEQLADITYRSISDRRLVCRQHICL